MSKDQAETVAVLDKKQLTTGMVVVVSSIILFFSMWISFQMKNFVVTRDEGDVIKARINSIEVGMDKINDSIKNNHKENEEKLNNMKNELKQDMLDSQKEIRQDMTSSQTLILNRLGELRTSLIDSNRELRDKFDSAILDHKRRK